MAILADEIKDIENKQADESIGIVYEYIKYMHEQIEFWGANREKEIKQLQSIVAGMVNGGE